MMRAGVVILFFLWRCTTLSQDTTCGIVWFPPMQISPGVAGVDESIPSLAVQGDTVHITWANSSQRFPYRRSTNGGLSFEPVMELAPDSTPLITNGFILSSGASVYGFWIDYESIQNTGWMIRSSNYGITWDTPRMIRDSTGFWHFGAASGDTVVLGIRRITENRRTYYSTNAGVTWTESAILVIGNNPRIAMTPGIVHRAAGWIFDSAGVWSEYVVQYRNSTDLGETWSDSVNLSTMSSRAYEPSIAAAGYGDSATVLTAWKDVKYGCLTISSCSVLGRRSTNSGNGFEEEQRFDVEPRGAFTTSNINGKLAVVGWSDESVGVFVRISTDGGQSWCAPYLVAPGGIQAVALSSSTIHIAWYEFIGGRYRVFYRRGVLLPTRVRENLEAQLPFVHLSQNYPNPFNPSTTIGFRVSRIGHVTLKVFDMLGKEVTTLVNEKMDAGEHTAEWNAVNVPSGVYYYRLRTETSSGVFTDTRKMILIH